MPPDPKLRVIVQTDAHRPDVYEMVDEVEVGRTCALLRWYGKHPRAERVSGVITIKPGGSDER